MRFAHNSLLCSKNTLVKFRWLPFTPNLARHFQVRHMEDIPRILSEYRHTNVTFQDGLSEWKGDGYLCVGETDTSVVGLVRLDKFKSFWGLSSFVIDSKYRGFGYGSTFLNNIQQRLDDPIYLRVKQENESAIKLYEKHGFETIGHSDGRYLMKTDLV